MKRLKRYRWMLFLLGVNLVQSTYLFAQTGPLVGAHIRERDTSTYLNAINQANSLHLKTIRVPIDWAQIEPFYPGGYNPNYIRALIDRLQRIQENGQKAIIMMGQSPGWANGNNHPKYPPTLNNFNRYAATMFYLHRRFLQDEGVNANTILAWEVWNEPNAEEFWSRFNDIRPGFFVLLRRNAANEYAELLSQTYHYMKAGVQNFGLPNVTILGGSLASGDAEYLNWLFDHWAQFGQGIPFDGLAVHPYAKVQIGGARHGLAQFPDECNIAGQDPLSPPWCFKKGLENVRQVLNNRGAENREIWITEWGTHARYTWGGSGSVWDQQEHANRAFDVIESDILNNNYLRIKTFIFFQLYDQPNYYWGQLYENGQEKPVAQTIRNRVSATTGRLTLGVTPPSSILPLGSTIAFRTVDPSGGYVWGNPNDRKVWSNGDNLAWSKFQVTAVGNNPNTVAFKHLASGRYLQCQCDSSGSLILGGTGIGGWETFTVVDQGNGQFALKAYNDRFVFASLDYDNYPLSAYSWATSTSYWTLFTYTED